MLVVRRVAVQADDHGWVTRYSGATAVSLIRRIRRDVSGDSRPGPLDTYRNAFQASRTGNRLTQMLSISCTPVAAAGHVDCCSRCSLCDVAAMEKDASLDDPEGEEHQERPEDRPLHAFTEAALIAGHDLHGSELGELGADVNRDQSDHDPGNRNGSGQQDRILRRLTETALVAGSRIFEQDEQ